MTGEPTAPVSGWRWWMANEDGYLSGGVAPIAWPAEGLTAECVWQQNPEMNQLHRGAPVRLGNHDADQVPAPGCECGLRVMPKLDDVLVGMTDRTTRWRHGVYAPKWLTSGGVGFALHRVATTA